MQALKETVESIAQYMSCDINFQDTRRHQMGQDIK
jgi:hypothetical protein